MRLGSTEQIEVLECPFKAPRLYKVLRLLSSIYHLQNRSQDRWAEGVISSPIPWLECRSLSREHSHGLGRKNT